MDLTGVHPVLQAKVLQLEEKCKIAGINIVISQAYRSIEYQDGLYAQGRTTPGKIVTNCKGGFSPHNYGFAIDYAPLDTADVDKDGIIREIIWDGNKDPNWKKIGEIAESLGLEWGYRWKSFPDMPHLELKGASHVAYLLGSHKIDSGVALKMLNLAPKEHIKRIIDIPKYTQLESRAGKLFGYLKY